MTAEILNSGGLSPEKQRIIEIRELRKLVREGLLSEEVFRRRLSLYDQRPLLPTAPAVIPVEETKPQMTLAIVETAPPAAERQIVSAEVATIYRRVTALIPETDFRTRVRAGYTGPAQYEEEIRAFSRYALDFQTGRIAPIDPFKAVRVPSSEKTEVAQDCLRQMLVPIVIGDGGKSAAATKLDFTKRITELRDFLGSQAEDILRLAVESLSNVEQALLFSSASEKLMAQLGYLDLEVCDETRLAKYLCENAFGYFSGREERFEQLLEATIARGQARTLDLGIIVKLILERPYNRKILERLIEDADYGCFGDHLTELFSAHHRSQYLLSLMAESEDGSESVLLPYHRLQEPGRFHGRRKVPIRGRYHD